MFKSRKSIGVAATTIAVIATLVATQPAIASTTEGFNSSEPETVTILGEAGIEFGEQVSLQKLAAAAHELGQDISTQLDANLEGSLRGSLDSSVHNQAAVTTAEAAWDEVNRWDDNRGVRVVLRYGNGTTWGWIKARDKHGVTQTMIQKTTQFPRTRTQQGTAFVYVTPAIEYSCWLGVCTPVRSMDMRVVNETTNAQGVITAYCDGVTICPKWVRDAAAG